LDRAIGEPHRKGAVARVQLASLGLQSLVGVGTLLENPTDDGVGGAARGRYGRRYDTRLGAG
jgi:hypothetical protein